jgi:hypothetical protein
MQPLGPNQRPSRKAQPQTPAYYYFQPVVSNEPWDERKEFVLPQAIVSEGTQLLSNPHIMEVMIKHELGTVVHDESSESSSTSPSIASDSLSSVASGEGIGEDTPVKSISDSKAPKPAPLIAKKGSFKNLKRRRSTSPPRQGLPRRSANSSESSLPESFRRESSQLRSRNKDQVKNEGERLQWETIDRVVIFLFLDFAALHVFTYF